jgi:hypothetical protein
LDAIECGVVGVFIAPTTKNGRWKAAVAWRTGQSGAPPDSPVRHRTLSGAPATSADCWGSTVEALTGGSCRLSDAPTVRALYSTRADAH